MKQLCLLSFFCLNFATSVYGRVYVGTNVIIQSLPQLTREGIMAEGAGLKIHLTFREDLALGQQIYVEGLLYPESRSLYGEKLHIVRQTTPFWRFLSRLRLGGEQRLQAVHGEEAASLALSLVFGNRHFLNPLFQENLKAAGMSHFLALSGLHLALASGAAALVFRLLGMKRRQILIATLPFSLAYFFMGGMGISLIRALAFHGIWALSSSFRWNFRLEHVFILTLLLMAPLGNRISFLLSISALGGIIFLRGFWEEIFQRFLGTYGGSLAASSLAAGIGTLPLSLLFFGEVNKYFLLANIIILPFASFIVLSCLGAVLIPSAFWETPLTLSFYFLLGVSRKIAQIPHSLVFIENKTLVISSMVLSFLGIYIMIRGYIVWSISGDRQQSKKDI